MRRRDGALLSLLAAAILGCHASAGARPAPPVEAKASDGRWQDDPVCRMVFFAVLEGLYEDGVPTEVVDLVVPRGETGDDAVKHCFVIRCPLCNPVYEAFRLYQVRKPFASDPERADTFRRKPVAPETVPSLRSSDVYTRIRAMGGLVQPWIERRLESMRLTEAERVDWRGKLLARAKQGDGIFAEFKHAGGNVYAEKWFFYDGCQACKAVEQAVKKDR
jgi:hypothetical protein